MVRDIAFCGVDEVTEIAYLSLRETDLRLVAVMDDAAWGQDFFGIAGGTDQQRDLHGVRRNCHYLPEKGGFSSTASCEILE